MKDFFDIAEGLMGKVGEHSQYFVIKSPDSSEPKKLEDQPYSLNDSELDKVSSG